MPNPFFSGRIPPDLSQAIDQHIAKTGESKTQILIKALAAYVNHPIRIEEASISAGVSLDLFSALEQRVVALEQSLKQSLSGEAISRNPNGKHLIEATDNTDSFGVLPDLWLNELFPISETKPDNSGNAQIDNNIRSNENILLLAPAALDNSSQTDNADNTTKNIEPQEPKQAKLFDTSEESIGPYSELKMAEELGTNRSKLRRHLERIEKGQTPPDTPLEVTREGQLYHVKYLGKPHGRKLWIAEFIEPEF